jgi:Asp/Glu/hydantoin racemase
MTTQNPVIALVSAVTAAIAPATEAFASEYPDASVWNILDDRLLVDADARGGVTADLDERMARLIRHAAIEGADGILLTCSLYGTVAHRLAAEIGVPLMAPDDALFAAVADGGFGSILLLSPAPGPLAESAGRLTEHLRAAGLATTITGAAVDGAADAARSGDLDRLVSALEAAYLSASASVDAVVLGQYSLSPAAEALSERIGVPVLAGPGRAARALRSLIEQRGSGK